VGAGSVLLNEKKAGVVVICAAEPLVLVEVPLKAA
jgi:hypothetical protein